MRAVRHFMTLSPYTISAGEPLSRAHAVMREHEIRHLPVVSSGELIGVVSQRDLRLIETLRDVDPDEVTVEEAMSPIAYAVPQDRPLEEVVRQMADQKYGSAVVTHNGAVVGIVTTTDVCRVLADFCKTARSNSGPSHRKRPPARRKKTVAAAARGRERR